MNQQSKAGICLNVGLIQQNHLGSKARNLDYVAKQINHLAKQHCKLVVLQELHGSAYFCQTENTNYFDQAESIEGPTFNNLSALAKQHNLVIVGSIFEKRAPGLHHNTAIVIECDGSLAGYYRKMHIPDDPGYYEKFYFTPGDYQENIQGHMPISTSIGKLGVMICWDQWFPEAARLMALAGADILIYPTAIGWNQGDSEAEQKIQLDAWLTIQRSHAIANGIPLISCNRTGIEADPSGQSQGIHFWGNSFISGPQGEILLQADANEAATINATLDLSHCEKVRQHWPFLRDRRIDSYQQLTQRFLK